MATRSRRARRLRRRSHAEGRPRPRSLARLDRSWPKRTICASAAGACSPPSAPSVARRASTRRWQRVYRLREERSFDFDSKYITQPGNALGDRVPRRHLRSFGYEPQIQWFDADQQRQAAIEPRNIIATLRGTDEPRAGLRGEQPLRLGRGRSRRRRRHVGHGGAARGGAHSGAESACRRRSFSPRSPARKPACSAAASSCGRPPPAR